MTGVTHKMGGSIPLAGEMYDTMSLAWIFAVLVFQRLIELELCRRNRRVLIARGGKEFYPETYPLMVALHTFFFLSLAWESYPWRVPLDLRTIVCFAGLVIVTALRYWSIATLGRWWSTRIVVVPGSRVVRDGPYRYFRHPNYLVIILEFLLFPFLLRAPYTLVAFSLANLPVLHRRIRLEEKVLRETTDFGDWFP